MHPTNNNPVNDNSSINIAIIAHSLYPIAEPYAGGLEMITQQLCDAFVEKGHQVTLYAHQDSKTKAILRPFMSRQVFDAQIYAQEHESLGMTRDELYQYHLYQDAMREIIEKTNNGEFDIVHNHSLHHVPMLTGQALGARLFTTFHTPIFAHLRLALLTLRHGTDTQFTSISHFQQQLFAQFVPSTVVYNGIDVDSFKTNLKDIASENYFWFGRICPEKGTHLAIDYCLAAGKKLTVAGPKSNPEYFEEKVAPLLSADNVDNGGQGLINYVGHLTKAEINNYLTGATAVLFTSTWDEPYGLTLAESLACGCPVIGFDVGAASEIISDEVGVIVPKMDKQNFINAFDDIKTVSRQACRDRAQHFCSVNQMVDGYLKVYYDTLSQPDNRSQLSDKLQRKDSQGITVCTKDKSSGSLPPASIRDVHIALNAQDTTTKSNTHFTS